MTSSDWQGIEADRSFRRRVEAGEVTSVAWTVTKSSPPSPDPRPKTTPPSLQPEPSRSRQLDPRLVTDEEAAEWKRWIDEEGWETPPQLDRLLDDRDARIEGIVEALDWLHGWAYRDDDEVEVRVEPNPVKAGELLTALLSTHEEPSDG